MKVVVIDYGAGNIQSVFFALRRLDVQPILSANHEIISTADKVIFPGVGEASSAMKRLKKDGLDLLIPQLKQPLLGICLGMQLLCESSEENNTPALGVFPLKVKRFTNIHLKVPQMGWNDIKIKSTNPILSDLTESEFVYFVHSYYAEIGSHTIATCNYGIEFSAALAKNNFYAVQFHPEKSALAGEKILNSFLRL